MTTKAIRDVSGAEPQEPDWWDPIIFTRAEIDADIERLGSLPAPANGRRESSFIHPRALAPGLGLAPGIEVRLAVLLPGEQTRPIRHNSTQIHFCLHGSGVTSIRGSAPIAYKTHDVFNLPSFRSYQHRNDSDDICVRLTYSNAPLLEKLNVHVVEENPRTDEQQHIESVSSGAAAHSPFGTFELDSNGASLMPYELLINPPVVESRPLHWRWGEVKAHLDRLDALGAEYRGRRLYLLYNPSTGRVNGTTPSFFATMTIRPPRIVDRPHRHVSAAINYYFKGNGYSRVGGQRYEWGPGDLMLSAPGWVVHHHASGDEAVYELTVQDQPLNIAMESLLWQENLKRPPVVLGSEPGFATNRALTGG